MVARLQQKRMLFEEKSSQAGRNCPDYVLIPFLLTRNLMKRRRKRCPPLPAQRSNLTEQLHTGASLLSFLINGLTQVKLFSCIFQCKNLLFWTRMCYWTFQQEIQILWWYTGVPHSWSPQGIFLTGPVGTGYFSFIAVAIRLVYHVLLQHLKNSFLCVFWLVMFSWWNN